MPTKSKRTLIKIAAEAGPGLKAKLAGMVLSDSVLGQETDCIALLRKAALAHALTTDDRSERKAALSVLEEVSFRGSRKIFDIACLLTPKMRDKLAELATVGHVVCGGIERLLVCTAMIFAISSRPSQERDAARTILKELKPKYPARSFATLVNIGVLTMEHMEAFLEMQLELATSTSKSSPPPGRTSTSEPDIVRIPSPQPLPEVNESDLPPPSIEDFNTTDEPTGANPDPASLADNDPQPSHSPVTNDAPPTLRAREPNRRRRARRRRTPPSTSSKPPSSKRKRKRNGTPTVPWDEREELQDTKDATELRNADLRNKRISKGMMYKVICVFCFRATGYPAFVGDRYADIGRIQGNLTKLIQGDRPLKAVFSECWKDMVQANAIQIKKKKGGGAASLPCSASGITSPRIAAVVEWALSENRKLSN